MIYTDIVIYKLGANGFNSHDTVAIAVADRGLLTRNGRTYTLSIDNIRWASPGQKKKKGFFKSGKSNPVPRTMKMLGVYFLMAKCNGNNMFMNVEMIAANQTRAEFDVVELNPTMAENEPAFDAETRRASTVVADYNLRDSSEISEGDIDALCRDLKRRF